jgi:beta-glucosidase
MPWLDAVPGVLQAWYAGQEQGTALAGLLFGDVTPSGKLPITFPRALEDTPGGAAAVDGADAYGEGVLAGYRWYDARGLEPLFPFGFGLSYTRFEYRDVEVEAGPTDGDGEGRARVAFTVANAGDRAGAEVAQVYVGSCDGDGPVRQLAGFAKVPLAPGESARVRVELAREALSRWRPDAGGWETPACDLPLLVGASSRDLRLRATVRVAANGSVAPVTAAGGGGGGCGAGAGGAASLLSLLAAWGARASGRSLRARRESRARAPPAPRA